MVNGSVFVDWLTAYQLHPEGGLPILTGGIVVHYDAQGIPVFERNKHSGIQGSHDTSIRVGCDGRGVSLAGNPGRFCRQDNLFNFGWKATLAKANRILDLLGIPAFTPSSIETGCERPRSDGQIHLLPEEVERRGAGVSRLDLTCNYATGSEIQARAFIRWLSTRSVKRARRGVVGDESCWYANTRHMFKAYIKHIEMVKHGMPPDHPLVIWAKERGIVRVEVELKKRLISELGITRLESINDEKLDRIFHEQTAIIHSADRSSDEALIESLPQKTRVYAAAWLAGQDMRAMCSRATLFRHAKALRECGIDILQPRDIHQFPVKVREITLEPLTVPDWYDLGEEAAA